MEQTRINMIKDIKDILKIKRPIELDQTALEYILDELNKPENDSEIDAIKSILVKFNIPADISTKQLGILIQYWFDYSSLDKNEIQTGVSLNSLELEKLIDNYEKKKAEKEKTIRDSNGVIKSAQDRQREIIREREKLSDSIEKTKKAAESISKAKIYATAEIPETPNLDLNELKDIKDSLNISLKGVEELIIQSGFTSDSDEAAILARAFVVDVSKKIEQPQINYTNNIQIAVLTAVSIDNSIIPKVLNQNDLIIQAKSSSTLISLNKSLEPYLFKTIAKKIIGDGQANYLYGPDTINVVLSDVKNPDSNIEIDIHSLFEHSIKLQEKRLRVLDELDIDTEPRTLLVTITQNYPSTEEEKKAVIKPRKNYLEEFKNRINGSTSINTNLGDDIFNPGWVNVAFDSESILKVFVEPAKNISSDVGQTNIAVSILKLIPNNTAPGAGEVSKLAVKTGIKESITALFAAAGTTLGPLGTIVLGGLAWIGGELFSKFATWWNKNKEITYPIAAIMLGFGALPIWGPTAALTIAGTSFLLLAGSGATALLAGGVSSLFGFMWRNFVVQLLAGPIFFLFVVVPLLTAFILLIINSGAYVVPPGLSSSALNGGADNPYMLVTKIASPNKIDNPTSPQQVIYGVSIKAIKESLFNVRITAVKCTVNKKNGQKMVCPDEDVPPLEEGKSISPTQVHAFSFISRYDARFNDSLVVDSIEVTAETADGTTITTSGFASLCIGDCPNDCPSIWPTSHGRISQGAKSRSGFSHNTTESIDVAVSNVGVFATHSGTVVRAEKDSCYGNRIQIKSTCNGKDFISQYAHLEGIAIKNGQTVTMGQTIGVSGNTGTCTTGPHLHYEFKYYPSGTPNWPNNPPFMMKPYIPQDIKRGCSDEYDGGCGVSF